MDIIDIIFFIFLIFSGVATIKYGIKFMTARDMFMKSEQTEYPKEIKKLRKKFISNLIKSIIFILAIIF